MASQNATVLLVANLVSPSTQPPSFAYPMVPHHPTSPLGKKPVAKAEDDDEEWSFTKGLIRQLLLVRAVVEVVSIHTPQDGEHREDKDKNLRILERILSEVKLSECSA